MERKSHLNVWRVPKEAITDFDDQADVNFESLVGSDFRRTRMVLQETI